MSKIINQLYTSPDVGTNLNEKPHEDCEAGMTTEPSAPEAAEPTEPALNYSPSTHETPRIVLQQQQQIQSLQDQMKRREEAISRYASQVRVAAPVMGNWILKAVFHGWRMESYVQNMIRRTTASLLKKDKEVEDAELVRDVISHRMMQLMNGQNNLLVNEHGCTLRDGGKAPTLNRNMGV